MAKTARKKNKERKNIKKLNVFGKVLPNTIKNMKKLNLFGKGLPNTIKNIKKLNLFGKYNNNIKKFNVKTIPFQEGIAKYNINPTLPFPSLPCHETQ